MGQAQDLASLPGGTVAPGVAGRASWRFSLPLTMGLLTYAYLLGHARLMLRSGDTYWHVAAGRWILEHGVVPTSDPFSHTMRGAPWTAHEWLSEVAMAMAHRWGGWTLVVAICALAFATAIALLARALLRQLEPIYALLFAALAVFMTAGHALARPHLLAMPLLMLWMIELVRARDEERAPRLWLLPVMTVWANLHGGFTLGIALAAAFTAEAVLANVHDRQRLVGTVRSWGLFLLLALGAALVTPNGARGLWFTWEILIQSTYSLQFISEWQSPNFHVFQPLELWLLGGLALVLHQGLRLPPMRIVLLMGLLHLSLKHSRSIELVGLLAPLVVAGPFARQWRERQLGRAQLRIADECLARLARPAGRGAVMVAAVIVLAIPLSMARRSPLEIPEYAAPALALRAAHQAGLDGPVLNTYDLGGYLAFAGIPPFIDGRADMYGDPFLEEYVEATQLTVPGGFEKLVDKYRVTWTLLRPGTPAIALLDRLPQWRRLYADKWAVVHVHIAPEAASGTPGAAK